MSTLSPYNGLLVLTPESSISGPGGKAINDNFIALSTKQATTDPTPSDDSTQGYTSGSRWFNTSSGIEWICTNPAATIAVWTPVTASLTSGPSTTDININSTPTGGDVYVTTSSFFKINGSGDDILVFGGSAGFTITTNSYGGMNLGTNGYQVATQGSVLNLNSLEFGVSLPSGDAINLSPGGFGLSGSGGSGYSLSVSPYSFGVTTGTGSFGLGPAGFGVTVADGSSMGISNVGAGIQTAAAITLVSGAEIDLNGTVNVNTPSFFRINGSGDDILVFGGSAGFTITTNSYGGMSLGTDGYQITTQGCVLNLNALEFGVSLATGDAINLGGGVGFGLSGPGYSLGVSQDSFGVTTGSGSFGLGPGGFGVTVPDGSSMGISNAGAGIKTAGSITLVGSSIIVQGSGINLNYGAITAVSSLQLGPTSAPGSPTAGQIYFDSTSGHFYGYNGSAWKQLDN